MSEMSDPIMSSPFLSHPLVGGSIKAEKWGLGIIGLVGTLGMIVWQLIAASVIWHEHRTKRPIPKNHPDYRPHNEAHRFIMPTIIIASVLAFVMTSSLTLRTLLGLAKMGPTRLAGAVILGFMIYLNISLRARYTEPDEKNGCPQSTKLTSVWRWWEIPALAMGSGCLVVLWGATIYMVVQSKGELLRRQ
jgi:hypothetical protein